MKPFITNSKSRWASSFLLIGLSITTFFFSNASGRQQRFAPVSAKQRTATHVGANVAASAFAFSPAQRLVRPPIPPTPGVTLKEQDIEPEIKIDLWGNIYVTAIHGVPGGVDLWKSTDKGQTFVWLGEPDGAQDKCDIAPNSTPAPSPAPTVAPVPCTVGAGGGDDSIDVSSGGYLYVSSLWLGGTTVSTSFDGGVGGTLPGQAWQVNPKANGDPPIPVNDRQWVAAYGPQTLNMTFDNAPVNAGIWFTKSTDAGKTFSPPVNITGGVGTIRRTNNLIVDPYNGNLYTSYTPTNLPNQLNLVKSTDGGATWTISTIYTGPSNTSVENAFPILAVDRGGNLHVVFTRSTGVTNRTNAHVFLMSSTDQGQTWLPPVQVDSGANTQSTVMPWIAAGSSGVVDVTWYGSSSTSPDAPPYDWHVFFAQTTNALSASPTFTQVLAIPDQVHDDAICSAGGNCAGTSRTLAEYYTMTLDPDGSANIAFVDHIHNCKNGGPSNCAAYTWYTKQTSGPSAYAPPSPPGPATFAANVAIAGQNGTAEPNIWVDSHNCIYAGAIGGPRLSKSTDAGLSFTTKTVALGSGVHGGDFDVITFPKPDGTRPDQVYTADLGITTVHIGKSIDGFNTFFQPGTAGAAGEVSVSSDRMWLYPDKVGANQNIYLVDHEFTTEAIRFSALTNDSGSPGPPDTRSGMWSPFTDGMPDPELTLPPNSTLPNTQPGPVFVDRANHNVLSVFAASTTTTNSFDPPFGKEPNVWDSLGAPPAAAGAPPGPFSNHPIFKGVIDSPTSTPAPPPGAITYGTHTGAIFPSGDGDSVGNVYAVWSMNSARPNAVQGNNAPTHTFDIWMAASHDGGVNFYGPWKVSSGTGTALFPWIAAGDKGRVDIAWYQSSNVAPPLIADPTTPGQLTGGPNEMPGGSTWNVMFAQSLNADSREPVFTIAQASDHINHTGSISIGGLTGSSDRSLLDFFEVAIGPDGLANIAFADNGLTPTHITYARQNSGPLALTNPVFTTCLPGPPAPLSAVSRKTHGNQDFDIDLLPPAAGIEMRRNTHADTTPPSNVGHDHRVVVTFPVSVTLSSVTVTTNNPNDANNTPPPSATFTGNNSSVIVVDLHDIPDQRRLTITLNGVVDSNGNGPGPVTVPMGVLYGDCDQSARVDSNDVTLTRQNSLQPVTKTPPTFEEDVDLSDRIDSNDVTVTRQNALHSLP